MCSSMSDDFRNSDNYISQSEELLALQSMYDDKDLVVENEQPPSGRFAANVILPKPFYVCCRRLVTDGRSDSTEFQVDYLPPINLLFQFPSSYPSHSCPAFLLTCTWLTRHQLSQVCRKLESVWAEGDGQVILYSWIQFLQEELLGFLNITDRLDVTELFCCSVSKHVNYASKQDSVMPVCKQSSSNVDLDDVSCDKQKDESVSTAGVQVQDVKPGNMCTESDIPCNRSLSEDVCEKLPNPEVIKPSTTGGVSALDCRAVLEVMSGSALLTLLKEYNRVRKQEAFKNMWVICEICYVDKKGSEFVQFTDCDHTFCHECLKSYFEIQIKDGNVHSLNCPDEGCSSQADGTLVKSLVSDDLFQKYDSMLLSRTLEGMSDIAYCPRKPCQTPVLIDRESKMGRCPLCSLAFCIFCRMAYHGIAPCRLRTEEKRQICKRYLEGKSEEKAEMERRYGKREIKWLVENLLSEEWVDSNSKACPHCHSKIEKSDGCNKMTCYRCGSYFCWLCLSRLKSSNPYTHFSDITSPCYNQLFPANFEFVIPGEFLDL